MATLLRYVHTGSSGGDGTTTATSGSTAAFASWSAALTNAAANKLAADVWRIIQVDAASIAGIGTVSASIPTSSTGYLSLEVDAAVRHAGVWDTSKARSVTTNAEFVTIENAFVRISGWQAQFGGSDTFVDTGIQIPSAVADPCDIRVERCLLRGSGGTDTVRGIRLVVSSATQVVRIGANVFHDLTTAIVNQASPTSYVYRNTIARCQNGMESGFSGRCRAKGNVFQALGTSTPVGYVVVGAGFHADSDYNLSSEAGDAPGTNSRNSQSVTFVNAGSNDFHLASGDTAARGFGLDLSADADYPLSTDIDGDTIGTPYDLGADEVASAVTTVTPTGQSVTASLGSVVVNTSSGSNATVTPAGQSVTAALGSVTVSANASVTVSVTGQSVTASLGTFTTQVDTTHGPDGLSVTTSLGTPTYSASSPANTNVIATGQGVTASLGTVTLSIGTSRTVPVTGLVALAFLGTPTLTGTNLTSASSGTTAFLDRRRPWSPRRRFL